MPAFVQVLRAVPSPPPTRSPSLLQRPGPDLPPLENFRGSPPAPQPDTEAAMTLTPLVPHLNRLLLGMPPPVLPLAAFLFPVARLLRRLTNLSLTSRGRPQTFSMFCVALDGRSLEPQLRAAATAAREAAAALAALLRPLASPLELPVRLPQKCLCPLLCASSYLGPPPGACSHQRT
jgi:hypothetical protein